MRVGPSRRAVRTALVAMMVAGLATPAGAQLSDAVTRRIDSVFAAYDRSNAPGCALGVRSAGRTVYARGYGMASLELGVGITPSTVFDIGSTSKQFTAAAILLLAAEGKLSLDDDIHRFLPELPDYGARITIRNILQHTSGLRDYTDLLVMAGHHTEDVTTEQDALDVIVRQRGLNFPPGTEYRYSNTGFFLASVIVKRASGMSLRDFARARLFEPLGMTQTQLLDRHALLIPGKAMSYDPTDSGGYQLSTSDWEQVGDGGVQTSVTDLARWDDNLTSGAVGGQALMQAMRTPGTLRDGSTIEYGLGLGVDTVAGLPRVSHGGAWAGFRAMLMRFPTRAASILVLCNVGSANTSRLAMGAAAALLDMPALTAPPGAPAAAGTPANGRLAGTYLNEHLGGVLRVTAADSGRMRFSLGGPPLALSSGTDGWYRAPGTTFRVRFDSAAARAWLHRGGPAVRDEPYDRTAATPDTSTQALAAFAGRYTNGEIPAPVDVIVRGRTLVLRFATGDEETLLPLAADLFRSGGTMVRFRRDAGGRITSLAYTDRGLAALEFARTAGAPPSGGAASGQSGTLILNARVLDGTGAPARDAAVRIEGDRIVAVGALTPGPGEQVVNAHGLVLAPGFIDTHSHHDRGLFERPDALAVVSQGVTTIIAGQDGDSPFPLRDFFAKLDAQPVAINVAAYSGHGTLRDKVLGKDFRRVATPAELARMAALLRADLDAGALGLSTGLEYDPGIYSAPSEVMDLAKVAASSGGRYISHIRSEDRDFWRAIDELIAIGREAHLPVQISHVKLAMRNLWGKGDSLIGLLDRARAAGVDVTADIYPYTYWQSTLTVLFPRRDFDQRATAELVLKEIAAPEGLLLGRFDPNPSYAGKTVAQIAALRGTDPATTLMALIKEAGPDGSRESVIGTSMDEPDVERLMQWPSTNFCSDGELAGRHPRGFGSFPRVLGHYVRERGALTLPDAVRKMTSLAAAHVGLPGRGTIAPGFFADLVLFDPATIADRSTPEQPQTQSVGVRTVWVNGTVVFDGGAITGRHPGRAIRRPTADGKRP